MTQQGGCVRVPDFTLVSYLHGGFERGKVGVVGQALAVTLLFNTQQDLDILTVLVAAGLLIPLHPGPDLALPKGGVLDWLLLWGRTLGGAKKLVITLLPSDTAVRKTCVWFTFTLEDFLDPSLKA